MKTKIFSKNAKFKKSFYLMTPLCIALCVAGCEKAGSESQQESSKQESSSVIAKFELEYDKGTELKVAAGYQKTNEAISFQDAGVTGEGIKLADGKTYHTGDLKPTWQFISEKLGINFTDKFTGAGSAEKELKVWESKLEEVDIVAGNATGLAAAGAEGKLIDLNQYLNDMPNFKAYLEENAIARISITGNTDTGAIYFSPYFDGVDDIERMPLMRADFVQTLLDGDTAYVGANRAVNTSAYTAYMPTSGQVKVESLSADGSKTQTITKDYSKYGNIVEKMNGTANLTGDAAVAMFREYIDKTYAGVFAKRSDLFLGYDACWDADEMVALLRCAVASLNDDESNPISGLYSRETSNTQREVDLYRFAGSLFGVRGLESRQDHLFFGTDGKLHDARQEEATYDALKRMNAMVQEGLVITTGSATSTNYLEKDAGLMSYDYNQTQTIMNDTKLNKNGDSGESYVAIMVPVAKWDDGDASTADYFRFTESWRSVKTDGWAISKAGVGNDKNKLNAALALIDFAFSVQGQITMSYGPDTFIKVKDSSVEVNTWADVAKKYETFNFNGKEMPIISDESKASLKELTSGNYTNYARRYLGSTLNGFPKSQAFEYQCTSEAGKKGSAVLSAAIGFGIIKHPLLSVNESNMWYTSVPTTLPTTAAQTSAIKALSNLGNDMYGQSKGNNNELLNIIKNGTSETSKALAEKVAGKVAENGYGGVQYLQIKNAQWDQLHEFYKKLGK